jgi:hypothetical protein
MLMSVRYIPRSFVSDYVGNSGRADGQFEGSLPVRHLSQKGYDFSVRRERVINGSFFDVSEKYG